MTRLLLRCSASEAMFERFIFDVLEIALWQNATRRQQTPPLPAVLALPGPAQLRASFQIPLRGHYEMNATMHQKRQLELLGGTNFDLIDSLGPEQAQYLIDYTNLLLASEAQEQVRVRQIEAMVQARAAQLNSDRRIITGALIAVLVVFGCCVWAWINREARRESAAQEVRVETEAAQEAQAGADAAFVPNYPSQAFQVKQVQKTATVAPQTIHKNFPAKTFQAEPAQKTVMAVPKPTPPNEAFQIDVRYSQQAAVKKYPALGVKDSLLNLRFRTRLEQWKQRADFRLNKSNWPEKLSDECAAELHIPAS